MGAGRAMKRTARLIGPTLRSRKLKARGYADGGAPDDEAPATFNPVSVRDALQKATAGNPQKVLGAVTQMPGRALSGLASLPQRAIEGAAEDVGHLGERDYEPQAVGPAMDAAMTMVGGAGIVPAEANALRTGIGITARGPQANRLGQFERLEAKGVEPSMNYAMSGWYRGNDGKLRYWLPDQGAKLKDAAFKDSYVDANGKSLASVPEDHLWHPGEEGGKGEWREPTVGDVWDHPRLFEAYPWLKDVKLRQEERAGWGGHYDPETGDIHMARHAPEKFEDVLHHEIVHAIQHREGFANGTNPDALLPKEFAPLKQEFKTREKQLEASAAQMGIDPLLARLTAIKDPKGLTPRELEIHQRLEQAGLVPEFQRLQEAGELVRSIESKAYDRYVHNHGESEARDAPFIRRNPGAVKRGTVPLHVNPEVATSGREIEVTAPFENKPWLNKAGGGSLSDDLPDAPWATAPKADAGLPDAPWSTEKAELPDVGAPAITAGQEEFSPGLPAAKKLAQGASNTAYKAMTSVPGSAVGFAQNTIAPFLHPIETAENVKNLGLGVLEKTGIMPGSDHEKYADAVGQFLKDRYGSVAAARKTLEEDPVGLAGDLSMLLTGGGSAAARLPGLVGRVGEAAGAAGRAIDPLRALTPLGDAAGAATRAVGLDRKAPVPTTRELRAAADTNYNNMHGYGVEVHRPVMNNVADNIMTELTTQGYRDYLAPKTWRAIDELRNPIGRHSTTQDIEGVRRILNKAAGDPAERDAARRAIAHIDDAMANLTPGQVAINPHFANRVAQEAQNARGNYAAFKRSEAIDELRQKAARQAESTGSGANIDNATRQRVRQILDNPKKLRGFSAEERAAMEALVRGSPIGNAARLFGKLAPSGVVSLALSAGTGFASHGPVGAIAVPAAGLAAKKLSDRMTATKLDNLSRQVRLRSPLGNRMPQTVAPLRIASVPGPLARGARQIGQATAASPFENSNNPFTP